VTVDAFEQLVLSQTPASTAWQPVTDYSFDARKAIEGKHPELILEVFKPERILDVGCGFKYLVRLLNELAGYTIAYGADVSNKEADFAFDLTQPELPSIGADLVICREVLEHLTVIGIRRAVTNLCAMSSRYVYLTTRFHPAPYDLLDVATSDGLDPTHISMLNQYFLRVLFVLEGFSCRPDLEARMDWQGKGRVLVYERAA
jgi:SAM-dependent methyltransferase